MKIFMTVTMTLVCTSVYPTVRCGTKHDTKLYFVEESAAHLGGGEPVHLGVGEPADLGQEETET